MILTQESTTPCFCHAVTREVEVQKTGTAHVAIRTVLLADGVDFNRRDEMTICTSAVTRILLRDQRARTHESRGYYVDARLLMHGRLQIQLPGSRFSRCELYCWLLPVHAQSEAGFCPSFVCSYPALGDAVSLTLLGYALSRSWRHLPGWSLACQLASEPEPTVRDRATARGPRRWSRRKVNSTTTHALQHPMLCFHIAGCSDISRCLASVGPLTMDLLK